MPKTLINELEITSAPAVAVVVEAYNRSPDDADEITVKADVILESPDKKWMLLYHHPFKCHFISHSCDGTDPEGIFDPENFCCTKCEKEVPKQIKFLYKSLYKKDSTVYSYKQTWTTRTR